VKKKNAIVNKNVALRKKNVVNQKNNVANQNQNQRQQQRNRNRNVQVCFYFQRMRDDCVVAHIIDSLVMKHRALDYHHRCCC
jgi:hypothetical protein